MDIDYSKDKMYFKFDDTKFHRNFLEEFNKQVNLQQRRVVVITDPHIAAKSINPVYKLGTAYDNQEFKHPYRTNSTGYYSNNFTNIWVKDKDAQSYMGNCWPG